MAWIMSLAGATVTRRAPQITLYDFTIKDEEKMFYLPFPIEPIYRGYPAPRDLIPRILYTKSNAKHYPAICDVTSGCYICAQEGRSFLEQNAPNDCLFFPTSVMHEKTRQLVDQPFFWIEILHRLDTVIWEKSAVQLTEPIPEYDSESGMRFDGPGIIWDGLGYNGLAISKRCPDAPHLWREHMWNTRCAAQIFISNELREKIEDQNICRSPDFYYVAEI